MREIRHIKSANGGGGGGITDLGKSYCTYVFTHLLTVEKMTKIVTSSYYFNYII